MALGISTSTLPLGEAQLRLDGQLVMTLSGANAELRASVRRMTIQRLVVVVPPCAGHGRRLGSTSSETLSSDRRPTHHLPRHGRERPARACGLSQGMHSLDVVCTGTTSPVARDWSVLHYARHEFHVRSLVTADEPLTLANQPGDIVNIGGHEPAGGGGSHPRRSS